MTKDELTGIDGLLRQLKSRFYERVLEAEMDEHLGYRKHDNAVDNTGNSRNGYTDKSVLDDNSTTDIHAPRDRNSTFEPIIIPKHEKRSPLFNDQIISMYSYSMSCCYIKSIYIIVCGVIFVLELILCQTKLAF
ncbi:transposase [Campylobacter sp. RM16192]|uniref:transposase n=1 Tax=Campylobacter sp. RM16192 TaxID=1660080 RepID=UPI001451F850|nr:transposase [Campylobacter sp. RM16192]QCD52534.1 mutator family transposase [Campylobacter sp. RM16192]